MKIVHNQTPIGERHRVENIMADAASSAAVTSIAFVTLAESGQIDEITAAEHTDVFETWQPNINYTVGQLRTYEGKLYKCVQAHKSQADWTPDKTAALWAIAGDPGEEWPEWSQPVGAHDAYAAGDKVTHNEKHWISNVDANVWEPGVFGWDQATD